MELSKVMSTSAENDKFVTLIASLQGNKPVRRRVRKDVIQSESPFLKDFIQDGATEIEIPLKRPKNLNLILEYVNEGQLTVSSGNHLESLWNDAKILGLVNLEQVCIQRLTDTISLDSWTWRLEFSQAQGLHELESKVLSFINANLAKCCNSSNLTSLSLDEMVQVLELPNAKTTVTESIRIALILDWIKANENDRSPQAHRLLEQVDLMNLTEDTLRSFLNEEPALRNWRSVAVFQRAIRLKRPQETVGHSKAVQGQRDTVQSQPVIVQGQPDTLIQPGPIVFELLDNRLIINMKQKVVASEESSSAQVKMSDETTNPEDSLSESRVLVLHEVSPPLPSLVPETTETVQNNNDDAPPPKMPRLEYSQREIASVIPSQLKRPKQKQILYFSQLSSGATSLNFVIVSAGGAISAPQHLLTSLPNYMQGVRKLIWNQEARNLCFMGYFVGNGSKVLTFNYMNGEGAPKVTFLPKMIYERHHHQPVLLNGRLYVFGGSQSSIFKNNDRLTKAEVLNMTAATWQWKRIAGMDAKRDLYAAACVGENIYLTGGVIDRPKKDEALIGDHAVCYQPRENRWNQLNFMKGSRCRHALAVLGHRIYVFGGSGNIYNDRSKNLVIMKSGEVYDVHNDMWTPIAPMLRPRYGGCAVEIEGKIYVIGGDQSSEGESESSAECYDPVSNSWTLVSESVDDQGLFASIAVIEDREYFLKGC